MASESDSRRALQPAALQQNPSLPFLFGCCCIGLILLAVALTIVMGLLPTYLPDAGDGMSRVNATNMEAYLAAKATSSRKRLVSSLSEAEGCTFGDGGKAQFRQTLLQFVKSNDILDVEVDSITIGELLSTSKKRSILDRETRQSDGLVYLVHMFFVLHPKCAYACQLNVASILQQKLANLPPAAFVFNNVEMYRDGAYEGSLSGLRMQSIPYISKLSPGKTKARPGRGPSLKPRTTTAMSMTSPSAG